MSDSNQDNITESAQGTQSMGPAPLVVPEGVKDVESYKRYLSLKDTPALKLPQRLIETSDVNITIDPFAHNARIQKNIVHLPGDEQAEILKRVKALKVIHLRVSNLKEKAFGLHRRKQHSTLVMGLLDERSSELIEYYGQLLEDKEVHKIVTTEWGYEISIASLQRFRRRNTDSIEAAKAEYLKDYTSLRLSHKKGRLQELQNMFIKRKQRWETSNSKEDEKIMLQILRQIQVETEDKTLRIDANVNANINIAIQSHIESEIMKGLTLNDIIIARVATRMNINPRFLISRLHNSYYSKHSGFVRPDGDLNDQQVTYPSQMVYNWKDIKEQHENHGDANVEDAQWEEVSDDDQSTGTDLKDILLKQIQKKSGDVNAAQERINRNTAK